MFVAAAQGMRTLPSYIAPCYFVRNALAIGVSTQYLLDLTGKLDNSGVNETADCDEDNLGG